MAIRNKPTNIVADRAQRILTITWSDGRDCHYSFAGLRAVCPCVLCQGGHANMGRPADTLLLQRAQDDALNLEPVSYTHLRAHETVLVLVCRLMLDKKKHTHT